MERFIFIVYIHQTECIIVIEKSLPLKNYSCTFFKKGHWIASISVL